MVIHLDAVHHSRFLVAGIYPQDIAFDAVVEGSGGDFDFALGTADIVPHGVNLVDGVGDQPVSHEEGHQTDEAADDGHGKKHAGQGDAGGLHGRELELLSQVSERHHGAQEGGQGNGQRQHRAAAPHQEFQDYLEFQALAHQLVNIYPEELHDQYEDHNRQDRQKRSRERFD